MTAIISRYKIPFLIALVIALAVVVLSGTSNWLEAVGAFVGSILAVFVLDLEFIIQAYIVDPESDISKQVKGYVSMKNIRGYFEFLNSNEYRFQDLTIRSVLFQFILVVFAYYTVATGPWLFGRTLVLSLLAQMLYLQVIELNKTQTLKRWFWIYKGDLDKRGYTIYLGIVFVLYLFLFTFV